MKTRNALRLEDSDSPLVLIFLSVTWMQAEDDATINSITRALIEKIDDEINRQKFQIERDMYLRMTYISL